MISVNKHFVEGFAFKTKDYKENSIILTIYSIDGFHDFVIKSGKKLSSKLAMYAQSFSLVKIAYSKGKGIDTLVEGEVINNFTNIKMDTYKQMVALSIYEYLDIYKDSIIDFKITYTFLNKLFELLDQTNYYKGILTIFEVKFWYLVGIQPIFKSCVYCDNPGLYFSIDDGGLLCAKHKKIDSINKETTKLINLIYHIKLDAINDEFLKLVDDYFLDLSKLTDLYYVYFFDAKNKNKALFLKLLK